MPTTTKEPTKSDIKLGKVKKTMAHLKGEFPVGGYKADESKGLLSAAKLKEAILEEMQTMVNQLDAIRKGGKDRPCIDMSFEKYIKAKLGFSSWDSLYQAIGIDPSYHAIDHLSVTTGEYEGFRWLIPEVFRAAIMLGLRRGPIYPNLIAGEESVAQRKITMPHIQMSNATPEYVEEAETIPAGEVEFGQRDVKIHKLGTGLKVSYEVQQYVSLNVLSMYLQDVGIKMGLGLDSLALDSLINGDDPSGIYSAPVIGVENPANGVTYRDLLRAWIRMGRIGRMPSGMLTNENQGIDILELPEFKGANYNNRKQDINLRTPIPQSQEMFIHGSMPTGKKVGMYDMMGALIKLNATGLLIENQRIVERQMVGSYVTMTTGFARIYRDAFLIIDGDLDFASNGFPAYMDIDAAEQVNFM